MNEYEFTLNSPLTKEDWYKITDVNMEHTTAVKFQTPSREEVEFVKAVRCKDCKYWETSWTPENHSGHYCPQINIFSEADFYCADGERRDSENG